MIPMDFVSKFLSKSIQWVSGLKIDQENAELFLEKLMTCPDETVDEDLSMLVLRGIPSLYRKGNVKDIVLRKQQRLVFANAIESANEGFRVCLTGNPGIGKTVATPFLIRSLLKQEACNVIYHMRGDTIYYIFKSTVDGKYSVEVRKKANMDIEEDMLFRSEKNAYVVDANQGVGGSCNPPLRVTARVFIVASHNQGHWGRQDFIKQHHHGGLPGIFVNFSMPTWAELCVYRKVIAPDLSMEKMEALFRKFGPVLRILFAPQQQVIDEHERQQMIAINAVLDNPYLTNAIITGSAGDMDSKDDSKPSSYLVGYICDDDKTHGHLQVISTEVRQHIIAKAAKYNWPYVSSDPTLFEAYIRTLMKTPREYEGKLQQCVADRVKSQAERPTDGLGSVLCGNDKCNLFTIA